MKKEGTKRIDYQLKTALSYFTHLWLVKNSKLVGGKQY